MPSAMRMRRLLGPTHRSLARSRLRHSASGGSAFGVEPLGLRGTGDAGGGGGSDSPRENEFRHNLATDEWVVFSSARRERPRQLGAYPQPAQSSSDLPAHDDSCPFCAGNERLTPRPVLTDRGDDDGPWRLRVVPNKYPAVSPYHAYTIQRSLQVGDMPTESDSYQLEESIDARGFHEVVIETPRHNLPTALAAPDDVERLVRAFRSRGRAMAATESQSQLQLRHLMYFKNSGTKAGASLLHPHSQILGLPIVPVEVAHRQRHAREWFLRFRRNVFQHTLEAAMRERDAGGAHRVVRESDDFLTFVPFAALSPFCLWIVPKASDAHFHEASDAQCASFAAALRHALRCLHFGLQEPDFNMVIRSAALETGGRAIYRSDLFFRWCARWAVACMPIYSSKTSIGVRTLRQRPYPHPRRYCLIIPRLGVGQMGGFEFSTGIQSNSSFPEDDAAFLRSLGPLD